MIYAKKERNTKHFMHNGEAYCKYCGQKITPDCEIDHHEVIEYYHCDCDDAIKQMDIEDKIQEIYRTQILPLRNSFPEITFENSPMEVELVIKK